MAILLPGVHCVYLQEGPKASRQHCNVLWIIDECADRGELAQPGCTHERVAR